MLRVTLVWRRLDRWMAQFDGLRARAATDAGIWDTSWLRERIARRTGAESGRALEPAPRRNSTEDASGRRR